MLKVQPKIALFPPAQQEETTAYISDQANLNDKLYIKMD